MPISLILTPFGHFHFRQTLAVKCIPDLRVCHSENTEIDCLSFFIEFFAWFRIVCDRYTPEYAHFTYFNPILPLSNFSDI